MRGRKGVQLRSGAKPEVADLLSRSVSFSLFVFYPLKSSQWKNRIADERMRGWGEGGGYSVGWQEETEAASPHLSRRTLITIIYNMYARTYACPGATDFFFYLYIFTPKSERQYAVWTYLVHLCFPFLCVRVCVYVYAFLRVWLLQLFFSFVYCSVASSSLPSFGSPISFCPIIIRTLTFSLLDHSTPVLPRIPRFFHFFFFWFIFPPLFPSHENYPKTRESKRDREVRRGGICEG